MNTSYKKHDVFISFAEPDRMLAEKLSELLRALGLSWFFAPRNLPRDSPNDWQKGILEEGLEQSRCFIPIFTRQSLHRRWVLFEAGAAAALKLKFLVTHVDGVEDKEINLFPYAHHLIHFKLYEEQHLKDLVTNIQRAKTDSHANLDSFSSKVDTVFVERRSLVDAVLCRARRRWVFIAGNRPEGRNPGNSVDMKHLKKVVELLSTRLIEAGFNISACPQVKPVGKIALEAAQKWMATDAPCPVTGCRVDYEIAGIYPIDQELRRTKLKDRHIQTRWREHLLEFRMSYLSDKDWLILIGGNRGSIEEFEAVDRLNEDSHGIKVCFITCFGGAAKKLCLSRRKNRQTLYIDGCSGKCRKWDDLSVLVDNIVQQMTSH